MLVNTLRLHEAGNQEVIDVYTKAAIEMAAALNAEGGIANYELAFDKTLMPEQLKPFALNNPENENFPVDIGIFNMSSFSKEDMTDLQDAGFEVTECKNFWLVIHQELKSLIHEPNS